MKTLTTAAVITFVSGTLLCVCSYVIAGYALWIADKKM